ncbi:MAG TPA: helix-turn-helix domain-containing protein [Polyangiaceae bacterium]|jgi:DNA-binding HxlR family transcriptional regulator
MRKLVDSQCRAFQTAIHVLGRPWTALILNLLQTGARRFSEIGGSAPGLTDKVLSARLKDLEARGLLLRHIEPGPPVHVVYQLTTKGRAFGRVAEAIERWGRELLSEPAFPQGGRAATNRGAAKSRTRRAAPPPRRASA